MEFVRTEYWLILRKDFNIYIHFTACATVHMNWTLFRVIEGSHKIYIQITDFLLITWLKSTICIQLPVYYVDVVLTWK